MSALVANPRQALTYAQTPYWNVQLHLKAENCQVIIPLSLKHTMSLNPEDWIIDSDRPTVSSVNSVQAHFIVAVLHCRGHGHVYTAPGEAS